jgi:endonuclease/exonuclease/phosphatase (EEP) superfamily protein YafD
VPRAELDFILVSEGIEVTDFRIPDIRFSDHRPLVCDFHIRSKTPSIESTETLPVG